jgi:hypothetical protein
MRHRVEITMPRRRRLALAQIIAPRQQALRFSAETLRPIAVVFLLCAAIGVELMVLAAWLPDTLDVWRHPDTAGYGDFPVFYRSGRAIQLNATYSPGLSLLMHPLTHFSMRVAFQIYFAINVAALCGVAWLAQRAVRSPYAKAAVALGVLALPQTHWALRVGHFTEILALVALCGLLLSERRPVWAGLLLGVLALKPQYLPVPLLYLLVTRNWRALGACVGALGGLALVGVAAMVQHEGFKMVGYIGDYYVAAVGYVAHNLTTGQQDQIYVAGWQYSWSGFLISAGIDPNPLLVGDLLLLSLGALALAWWKCNRSTAKVATALGMLLLTPHSTFYNWSMIAVAAALLLRADVRPRYMVPVVIVGLALAMAATQNATQFPVPVDLFRPAGTRGLYWIQPAVLATVLALAIIGRKRSADAEEAASAPAAPQRIAMPRLAFGAMPRAGAWSALAGVALITGYGASAYVSGSGPFHHDADFGRAAVLRALPSDFPAPDRSRVQSAGAGSHLPYRVEWDVDGATSEVAGILRQRLADGTWKIVDSQTDGGDVRLRAARPAAGAAPPVVSEIDIAPSGRGSRVRLEFSPLPSSLVPGYQRWLERAGLIVHNVDPGTEIPPVP